MLFIATDKGRQPPKLVPLTTADPTTLLQGDSKSVLTVDSISWSCKGTTTTLSIWVTDGTTTAYLKDTESITTRTSGSIEGRHIQLPNASWSLMAEAGTGNLIDIIVVFAKATQGSTA